MKFSNIHVYNFGPAIHGMRNPKNSWDLSDSEFGYVIEKDSEILLRYAFGKRFPDLDDDKFDYIKDSLIDDTLINYSNGIWEYAIIGEKDMKLATNLIKAGSEHRKFLRQIFVTVDITAPLFWWKEFDTYKVGTVANSTSTMHKLTSKPITLDCFETDDYHSELPLIDDVNIGLRVDCFIDDLEQLRQQYLMTGDSKYWKELVRWLPESWLQTRTVTMNYENLLAMCSKGQRRFHKLTEWSGDGDFTTPSFIKFARSLPYASNFIFYDEIIN